MISMQDRILLMSSATSSEANHNPHGKKSTSRSTQVWAKQLVKRNEDRHDYRDHKSLFIHNTSLVSSLQYTQENSVAPPLLAPYLKIL